MNDLKMFSNSEFGELGVMTVEGKEYFPATRCAKILGYKEPEKAIREKCKGVSKIDTPTAGGTQQVNYIPEGDLYRLIVSSKLPAAEKFERWVFDEVLPSIRKTGGYGGVNIEQVIAQTATAVVSEIMKQIVPALTKADHVKPDSEEVIWEESPVKKHRRSRCVITKLSPELRETVDEMLLRGVEYREVVCFLRSQGIGISQSSVCRYYNTYLA